MLERCRCWNMVFFLFWEDTSTEDHTVFRYYDEEGLGDVSEWQKGVQHAVYHAWNQRRSRLLQYIREVPTPPSSSQGCTLLTWTGEAGNENWILSQKDKYHGAISPSTARLSAPAALHSYWQALRQKERKFWNKKYLESVRQLITKHFLWFCGSMCSPTTTPSPL